MVDVDTLSRNLVAGATRLADRASVLARGVAVFVGVIAVSAYLTGLAALDGGGRTVWIVVGGALLALVVGAPLLARWRLRSLHRHATELVGEVVALLTRNTTAQRVVIDIQEAEAAGPAGPAGPRGSFRPGAPGTPVNPAVVVHAQRYGEFRRLVATTSDLRQLPAAMAAITSFPGLIAIGLMGAVLFGLLGFVFLLVWLI